MGILFSQDEAQQQQIDAQQQQIVVLQQQRQRDAQQIDAQQIDALQQQRDTQQQRDAPQRHTQRDLEDAQFAQDARQLERQFAQERQQRDAQERQPHNVDYYLKSKTKSNNAAIILITNNIKTNTKRILLVKDSKKQEWMIPGGRRESSDTSDLYCAFREFSEETSFTINPTLITKISSNKRKHYNNSITNIFIIHSTEVFLDYNRRGVKDNETDALYYMMLDDFIKLVLGQVQHSKVQKLVEHNRTSSKALIDANLIN